MADPRRMTPAEHGEAHALLVRAVTDPDWQAASQALDDLMRKLVVMHRLLEAEERLPNASRNATADRPQGLFLALRATNGPAGRPRGRLRLRRGRPRLHHGRGVSACLPGTRAGSGPGFGWRWPAGVTVQPIELGDRPRE